MQPHGERSWPPAQVPAEFTSWNRLARLKDPDLTNKKFRGNPTKAYRSLEPLRFTGEITDWQGHSPEALKAMKDALAKLQPPGVEAIED